MRIVLDTNVLVSGLIQPLGPPGQIVRLVASGELLLCHDPRILTEYDEVLRRPKFDFEPSRIGTLMQQILSEGVPVAARPLETRLPDPDDESFLEVALGGSVSYLITGNLRHYPAQARQGVEVVIPNAFIELYRTRSIKTDDLPTDDFLK